MTSHIAGWISWPIIALLIVVTTIRFRLLNEKYTDRLINHALVFAGAGLLLRERLVEGVLSHYLGPFGEINLIRQLSFCCIVGIVQALYGLARLWDGADPQTAPRRQRKHYLIGFIVSVLLMIAGTPARSRGLLIDESLGWPTVLFWVVFGAPIFACGVLVAKVCFRECRATDVTPGERVFYAGQVILAVLLAGEVMATPMLTLYAVLTHSSPPDRDMRLKATTFFLATTGATLYTTVPTTAAVLAQFGWDRPGRSRRRLKPMWADLTGAFPDVVVRRPAQRSTEGQLHRMIVEIYDALLRLRPHAAPLREADFVAATRQHGDPADQRTLLAAIQVARAYQTKLDGQRPIDEDVQLRILSIRPKAQHLTAASDHLIELAEHWPSARRYVA